MIASLSYRRLSLADSEVTGKTPEMSHPPKGTLLAPILLFLWSCSDTPVARGGCRQHPEVRSLGEALS